MIQGLRTVIYPVTDLAAGKAWYNQVLGAKPYFDEPFYVGYSVGGFELGLLLRLSNQADKSEKTAKTTKLCPQGPVTYWGVADANAELARLISLGAEEHESVADVGEDIKVATVIDPFGNVFGIIQNPTFKLQDVR